MPSDDASGDGYIDHASASALPLEMHSTIESFIDSDRGVGVFGIMGDNGAMAKIRIKTPVADGRDLKLQIAPETGDSRAKLVDATTGDSTDLALNSTTQQTVTTQSDCCHEWRTEDHCKVTCNPDGQCSCIEYRLCKRPARTDPCYCDIYGYDCTGCSGDSSC